MESIESLYYVSCDIWQRLCEEHNLLLDQTCEEYSLLLGSQIDELEEKTKQKSLTINRIKDLDEMRSEVLEKLTQISLRDKNGINGVRELITFFEKNLSFRPSDLIRFNDFLWQVIVEIQEQNKKNQLFINKALAGLQSIREDAMGKKSYSLYDKKGGSKNFSLDAIESRER